MYDGDDIDGLLLGTYCGIELPPEKESSNGAIHLEFVSDSWAVKNGFKFSWDVKGRWC